jgi:hypothetical protein
VKEGGDRKNGERSDGRFRLNSSFSENEFDMIDKLAMACGITPTRLQKEFVLLCLNNDNVVNHIQEKFKRRSRFRVIPSRIEGKMKFILTEKKSKK